MLHWKVLFYTGKDRHALLSGSQLQLCKWLLTRHVTRTHGKPHVVCVTFQLLQLLSSVEDVWVTCLFWTGVCVFLCFIHVCVVWVCVSMLCVHITGDPGCKENISIYCLMFNIVPHDCHVWMRSVQYIYVYTVYCMYEMRWDPEPITEPVFAQFNLKLHLGPVSPSRISGYPTFFGFLVLQYWLIFLYIDKCLSVEKYSTHCSDNVSWVKLYLKGCA